MRRHTLSILAFSLAAVAAQADVITITRSGDVLDVDSTTGASHVLFATHLQVNCLAATGGTYHTVSNGKFYRINLNNQTATVGATVDVPGDVRGLAIDGAGRVWAIIDDGGVDSLWTLNLSTGQGLSLIHI